MRIKVLFLGISIFGLLVIQGCYNTFNCESPRGTIISEEIILDSINGISFDVSGNVYLRQDSVQKVVVETYQNMILGLRRDVRDGIWNIGFIECFDHYNKFDVYITVPDLNSVVLYGSGNILGDGPFETTSMFTSILGSGNITLEIYCESVNAEISGSGSISLSGKTNSSDCFISGSGSIMALNLESDNCEVSIPGSGNCDVFVNDLLDVNISGSGSVRYKGNPSVNSTITGSGSVVRLN